MKAFTDASVRGAKPTLSDRMEVGDPSCRGLYLRVTSAGARSFSFRARPPGGGRVERLTLGTYPDLSLRDARLKADRLRRQIADGKNPFAHKHEAPTRSFAALAERYIDEYAIRHKRSFAKDQRNLRLHILPRWRDRDYASITRADVIQLIERIVAAGKPVLANHVHALVRGIFSFAMDVDLMAANPAARLRKRGVERIKTRVLTDDEIRLFWTRSVEAPIVRLFGLALRLVLVTGVRSGEAAGMARGEIEFGADGTPIAWTIPARRSKNGRAHFVPLSPLAGAVVAEALELAGADADFVFPSIAERGHPNSSMLAAAMTDLIRHYNEDRPGALSWKADPPTAHDLRRTCATRLSAAGVPTEDVAAILNHVRSDVTGRHYDMYRRADEKRRALTRWANILANIISPAAASNVVAMR